MSTAIRPSLPLVLAASVCLAAATISCSSRPGFNFNGDWRGSRTAAIPTPENSLEYTAGRVTLTIKNSQFEATEGSLPFSGTVQYDGNRIHLHAERFMGQPLERAPGADKLYGDIVVTSQSDGTLLYPSTLYPSHDPIRLSRVKP